MKTIITLSMLVLAIATLIALIYLETSTGFVRHNNRGYVGLFLALCLITFGWCWRSRKAARWIDHIGNNRRRTYWWIPGKTLQKILLGRLIEKRRRDYQGILAAHLNLIDVQDLRRECASM